MQASFLLCWHLFKYLYYSLWRIGQLIFRGQTVEALLRNLPASLKLRYAWIWNPSDFCFVKCRPTLHYFPGGVNLLQGYELGHSRRHNFFGFPHVGRRTYGFHSAATKCTAVSRSCVQQIIQVLYHQPFLSYVHILPAEYRCVFKCVQMRRIVWTEQPRPAIP